MREGLRRGGRTALQIGTVEAGLQLAEAFGAPITPDQHAAIIAFGTVLISIAQASLEDAGAIPPVLRTPEGEESAG